MKGERPAEIVGFARTMRAHAVPLSTPARRRVRHLRHRRRSLRHVQHLVGGGARASPPAACAVAKHGNRSVSSHCGSADVFEALGVNVAAAPAVVERCLHEVGIAFFFAPTFHPSMRHAGADAPRARRPHRVQPARPADQPGRRDAPARRRAAAGAHRAAGARAAAARLGARLGRARRRRPRRDLDDRLHQGVRVPRTARCTRSTCTRRTSACRRRRPTSCRAAMPRERRDRRGGARRRSRAARATSCCSTPARRCSSPAAATSVRDGHRRGGGGDRSRRGDARRSTRLVARRRSGGRRHERATPGPARDDRRGHARAIVEVRREREPRAALERRAPARARRAATRSRRALARAGRVNVIAECKRRSPSRGVLRADYDPVAIARGLRARRRRGDLGADRADVLRRRARAPRGRARGGRRCRSCARTSSSTSTSCSRRAPPAPTPSC